MRLTDDNFLIAENLHLELTGRCLSPDGQIDAHKMCLLYAGVLVETVLMFEDPADGMRESLLRLSRSMGCPQDNAVDLLRHLSISAHTLDTEMETGREIARQAFEHLLECPISFHGVLLDVIRYFIEQWAQHGMPRQRAFHVFCECARKSMGFEIAAQELCDLVIERKIAAEGWSLAEAVSGLSAVAGWYLGFSLDFQAMLRSLESRRIELPQKLDHVVHIMTQEAVRLGIPAGSDWRFGLAANDGPVNAPHELIVELEPYCTIFLRGIDMTHLHDQAVACAKAAGRMLALAAGGECPEMEPVIAKPLAMAAMTETYRSICLDYAIVS